MDSGTKKRKFWSELEKSTGAGVPGAIDSSPTSDLEETQPVAAEALPSQRFVEALQTLVGVADDLKPASDVIELLDTLLVKAMELAHAEDGSVLALDEDTGELVFVLSRGHTPSERLKWQRLAEGEGVAGWAAAHRRAAVVNDAPTDERFYRGIDDKLEFKTETIIAAPIIGGGRVLGVVEVLNKRGGLFFSKVEVSLVELMCRLAGELLYNRLK